MTDNHDLGLAHDLSELRQLDQRLRLRWNRRKMLTVIGGASAGAVLLAACGDNKNDGNDAALTPTTNAAAGSATSAAATGSSTELIPEETAGPYPGDGTNGPDALGDSGVVRSDIRSSFGSSSGKAEGVLLTIVLHLQAAGKPYDGAAVYLWHCDREGRYSMYSQGATDQNYLRGVQAAGSNGKVTFTSIFPACYPGRWPHVHFEVYRSLATASRASNEIRTSQLALPEDTCKTVYATPGYASSQSALSRVSLSSDMVFRDGYDKQLATVTGDTSSGYVAELTVNV
jgi:protocatechuate 3,4-dioxygenase beta subunit